MTVLTSEVVLTMKLFYNEIPGKTSIILEICLSDSANHGTQPRYHEITILTHNPAAQTFNSIMVLTNMINLKAPLKYSRIRNNQRRWKSYNC